MPDTWLKLAIAHYDLIAMASIGTIFVTGLILPPYRDALKKRGRKVYPVKYWPFKFSDKLETLGYWRF